MQKSSRRIKRIILLGRKGVAQAAARLTEQGIALPLIIMPREEADRMPRNISKKNGMSVVHDDSVVYEMIAKRDKKVQGIDLVVSYLYWKKIRQPLIDIGRAGCINFHPAPLPDYKSRAGYNTAILDGRRQFGVSAHFITTEEFDSGPIIRVKKFPIRVDTETAYTLERKTQEKLFELFKETIERFCRGDAIPTKKNVGGLYLTAKQLGALKLIDTKNDSLEDINKKIRAFFFPPYRGATLKIKGQDFTLINDEVLRLIAQLTKRQL